MYSLAVFLARRVPIACRFARCVLAVRVALRVNSGVRVKAPPKGRGAVIDAVLHIYGIALSLFIHNFVNKVNPPPVPLKS